MVTTDPRVDEYIESAPDFARPILVKLRAAFHAGCPDLVERIKWGMPSFEHKGILGGMVVFKESVGFGFWKSRLMPEFERTFGRPGRASGMGAKIERAADLPKKAVLVAFVKEAARLNEEGVKEPKLAKQLPTPRLTVPADLKAALAKSAPAKATFEQLAPSHRRDYVDWIVEAKRPETRAKRLATAIEWLAEGKRRNWKYERPRKGAGAG
jgi:uncharacterized protein YdeI (YjbR/CyaY-like superfamily)